MTQEQAFTASAMEGVKVSHLYFSEDEYLTILPNGDIKFEDGVTLSVEEFNNLKKEEIWKINWFIYNN